MAESEALWRWRFEQDGVLDLAHWLARDATGTNAIAAAVLCEKLEAMGALRHQREANRDRFTFNEAPPSS